MAGSLELHFKRLGGLLLGYKYPHYKIPRILNFRENTLIYLW